MFETPQCIILTCGNIKGGVGKSTLACNLAVHLSTLHGPGSVLVIDGDKQATAATFTEVRTETLKGDPGFACIRASGTEVFNQVNAMRTKFHFIIIDAGGQDNPSLRVALASSDKVIIPVVPQSFETWALVDMAHLVEEAQMTNPRLEPVTVVNKGRSTGSANKEIQEYVRQEHPSLNMAEPVLVSRQPWADAGSFGLSILEHKPKHIKSIREFNTFFDAVM